jgi:hypothetical protein
VIVIVVAPVTLTTKVLEVPVAIVKVPVVVQPAAVTTVHVLPAASLIIVSAQELPMTIGIVADITATVGRVRLVAPPVVPVSRK